MWKREDVFRNIEQGQAYSIAAAVVGELIDIGGKDKFMLLLANQTYENAMNVYGEMLEAIIREFEEELKSEERPLENGCEKQLRTTRLSNLGRSITM